MSHMHDRSNETWLRQFIPVDIYGLTEQMVGTPEFWPFVETEDGIFCYENRSIMSKVKIEWVHLEFTQSQKTPKSNRSRVIRVQLVLHYDDIRQEKEKPIKLLSGAVIQLIIKKPIFWFVLLFDSIREMTAASVRRYFFFPIVELREAAAQFGVTHSILQHVWKSR